VTFGEDEQLEVSAEQPGPEVETLTIRIPMRLQRRGGRKLIMTPEGRHRHGSRNAMASRYADDPWQLSSKPRCQA
jgi:hypothetical protein